MNIWDILALTAVAASLFFALRTMRRRKKQGGCSACGGGCSCCCGKCARGQQ